MASPRFVWDAVKRRITDSRLGRFVARRQLTRLRDDAATAAAGRMRALAEQAARGDRSPAAFRAGMREVIRNANGAQYLLGRGGVNAMQPADFRALAGILRTQYAFLDGFVRDLEAGALTEAQAGARAELYAGAGVRSHELGQAAAWGIERSLPEYPGDRCLGHGNCRCAWAIVETERAIECTWRLGGKDPCDPCRGNAARYNPLVLPKPSPEFAPQPVRLSAVRRAG